EKYPGVSPQAHAARLVLLARDGVATAALISATDLASRAHESLREGAYLLVIREIMRPDENAERDQQLQSVVDEQLDRVRAALKVAEHGATRGNAPTSTLIGSWMEVASLVSDADSLDRAIALAREKSLFDASLDAISGAGRAPQEMRVRERAQPLAGF